MKKHVDYFLLQERHLIHILCLTGTQLQLPDDTIQLEAKLKEYFNLKFNTNVDKYKSIATGYSSRVQHLDIEHFDSFSLFSFKGQIFCDNPLRIALVYRSPKLPIIFWINYLDN